MVYGYTDGYMAMQEKEKPPGDEPEGWIDRLYLAP
jgi:hypothetical protein